MQSSRANDTYQVKHPVRTLGADFRERLVLSVQTVTVPTAFLGQNTRSDASMSGPVAIVSNKQLAQRYGKEKRRMHKGSKCHWDHVPGPHGYPLGAC